VYFSPIWHGVKRKIWQPWTKGQKAGLIYIWLQGLSAVLTECCCCCGGSSLTLSFQPAFAARATRWVCEKNAQNVAQPISLSWLIHTYILQWEKTSPNFAICASAIKKWRILAQSGHPVLQRIRGARQPACLLIHICREGTPSSSRSVWCPLADFGPTNLRKISTNFTWEFRARMAAPPRRGRAARFFRLQRLD
jgi:hypothetical protein